MEPIQEDTGAHAPLDGVTVVEFAGIGPGPFCGMLLADLGAMVIRVDRPPTWEGDPPEAVVRAYRADVMGRSKQSIGLDLKDPGSRPVVEALIGKADAILEGFRPGVMERLGLGPEEAHR
ncbi:MAG: CoA transferase, partial [Actinomycetota bacterium]|nr:CoA transferase [Actinomycetota bacterium]